MIDRNQSSRAFSNPHHDDESIHHHDESSSQLPDALTFPSSSQPLLSVDALTMDDIEDGVVASTTHEIYVSNILSLLFWLKENRVDVLMVY